MTRCNEALSQTMGLIDLVNESRTEHTFERVVDKQH